MSEKLVIRGANRDDSTVVMQLIREFAANMGKTDMLQLTEEALVEHIFESGFAEVLLVEVDGHAVGYALYFFTFPSFAGQPSIYLEDIYITPLFRNQGYGKELMNAITKISMEKGCFRIEWKVLKWNRKAINFYHQIGAQLETENFTFMMAVSKSSMEELTEG